MYTSLPAGKLNSATFAVRKANNSVLFVASCRKSAHLLGNFAFPDTFLRTPFPLFSLVASFKLSDLYLSQTTSTLLESAGMG